LKSIELNNTEFIKYIESHLNNNQTVELKVKGRSMVPFFHDSKTIVIVKKEETYQKYDVILFKYENQIYLHRIIKIKKDLIIAQGDGALKKEYIKKSDIYGKVIDYHTNGKKIKSYRFKVKLWCIFRPIRRILLKFFKHM